MLFIEIIFVAIIAFSGICILYYCCTPPRGRITTRRCQQRPQPVQRNDGLPPTYTAHTSTVYTITNRTIEIPNKDGRIPPPSYPLDNPPSYDDAIKTVP